MSNFQIGDWVYADDWCYGQITDIYSGWAHVEFNTGSGGGNFSFKLSELSKAPAPEPRKSVKQQVLDIIQDEIDSVRHAFPFTHDDEVKNDKLVDLYCLIDNMIKE